MSALSSHLDPWVIPPFPDISHPEFIPCLASHPTTGSRGEGGPWKRGLRHTLGQPPQWKGLHPPERSGGTCAHPLGSSRVPQGTEPWPHSGWSRVGSLQSLEHQGEQSMGAALTWDAPHKSHSWCENPPKLNFRQCPFYLPPQ